ncbi:hypothetical protein [Actinobacillus minor]|uniref:hypothetical protein n=1 Tax=Actinobacillus minor TaxID=51047 RepID=UPI0026F0415E|nr:hypothetical protein [Actinobacillus minor]
MTRLEQVTYRLEQYQALAKAMMEEHHPCAKWLKIAIRVAYAEKLALEASRASM